MAPPSYSELGKQAMDILTKGYHFGMFKLNCKTKTSSGIEVLSSGMSNHASGKISGFLDTKYKYPELGGFTVSEKWDTNNIYTTQTVWDKLLDGFNLGFVFTFAPQSGEKTAKFDFAYGQENFKINSDINVDLMGPMINASGVFGYEDWLVGCMTSIDTKEQVVALNNFALGYKTGDTILHAAVKDGNVLNCSVFQKCADNIDAACQLSWLTESSEAKVGLGMKYKCDNGCTLRAKINDELAVGVGCQHQIYTGVTLFLSANIMAKNFSDGGHKFGVALELEA